MVSAASDSIEVEAHIARLWTRITHWKTENRKRRWEIEELESALRGELAELEERRKAELESLRAEVRDLRITLTRITHYMEMPEPVAVPKERKQIGVQQQPREPNVPISVKVHARWYIALEDQAVANGITKGRLIRQIVMDWLEDKEPDMTCDFPLPDKRPKVIGLTTDGTQSWLVGTSVPPEILEKIESMADKGWHKYNLTRYGLRGTNSTVIRAAVGDWMWEHKLVDYETYPRMFQLMGAE